MRETKWKGHPNCGALPHSPESTAGFCQLAAGGG